MPIFYWNILLDIFLQSDSYFLVELSNMSNMLFSYNQEVCNNEELTKHNGYANYKRYVVLIYGMTIQLKDNLKKKNKKNKKKQTVAANI